ncbi:hypothetical protein PVK06_049004 [Gossypium arboreum]|uniref:Uncharacterized protein n=1 Tax=Gossypium arboreum TaxID=29729 RepID=A0ABR0MI08_GOSAR|nr:hypothetical protein PVK06_049004 [Gossypium arboreum]
MSELFYKFPILSNPIKFIDLKTMVTLYCLPERVNTKQIQLFADLANAELVEYIHPVIIEIDEHGEDESDNNGCSDHEGEDFSDFDVTNDGNDYAFLVGNSSCDIVIRNDPEAYM